MKRRFKKYSKKCRHLMSKKDYVLIEYLILQYLINNNLFTSWSPPRNPSIKKKIPPSLVNSKRIKYIICYTQGTSQETFSQAESRNGSIEEFDKWIPGYLKGREVSIRVIEDQVNDRG